LTGILFISYAGLLGGAERVLLDCAAAVEGELGEPFGRERRQLAALMTVSRPR
jgi:hypothetical protein